MASIRVKLPDGSNVMRRFLADIPVQVGGWAAGHTRAGGGLGCWVIDGCGSLAFLPAGLLACLSAGLLPACLAVGCLAAPHDGWLVRHMRVGWGPTGWLAGAAGLLGLVCQRYL